MSHIYIFITRVGAYIKNIFNLFGKFEDNCDIISIDPSLFLLLPLGA
jgi:hypothetical protein